MLKHGFIFAALTALCWGMAPLFAKLGLPKVHPFIALSIRTLAIATVVLAALVVSGGVKELPRLEPRTVFLLACEGLLAGLIGQFFYFKALKAWEASRVVPVAASYPFVAFILAVLLLGEKITLAKTLGAVLVVSGILLLGF